MPGVHSGLAGDEYAFVLLNKVPIYGPNQGVYYKHNMLKVLVKKAGTGSVRVSDEVRVHIIDEMHNDALLLARFEELMLRFDNVVDCEDTLKNGRDIFAEYCTAVGKVVPS